MLFRSPDGIEPEPRRKSIIVVFENNTAREHAVRSAPELEKLHELPDAPSVQWRAFDELLDSAAAAAAALEAAAADVIVFAMTSTGDLPREVKFWIEHWLGKRSEREGAIVGLVSRANYPVDAACLKEVYLRHTALRAGMDYLSHVLPALRHAIPDSLDSYRDRAGQVTKVLHEILHATQPPPPAGL